MKRSCKAISLAVLGLSLAGGVFAQSTTAEREPSSREPASRRADTAPSGMSVAATKDWEKQHRASKIIGTDVYDMQGKEIGEVKDIVIDPKSGNINYAVVSFGGVMGVGGKYFAVPWKSIQATEDAKNYALNVDRDALKAAPGFDKEHWPDMADQSWAADVERYWQDRRSTGSPGASEGAGNAPQR